MRVSEGTSFENVDGTWSKPEIELDDSDFDRIMAEWGIPAERAASLPIQIRYQVLARIGQLFIANNQFQARKNDKSWLTSAGKPLMEAAIAEVKALQEKIRGS
jgi:hypothetical protein